MRRRLLLNVCSTCPASLAAREDGIGFSPVDFVYF